MLGINDQLIYDAGTSIGNWATSMLGECSYLKLNILKGTCMFENNKQLNHKRKNYLPDNNIDAKKMKDESSL